MTLYETFSLYGYDKNFLVKHKEQIDVLECTAKMLDYTIDSSIFSSKPFAIYFDKCKDGHSETILEIRFIVSHVRIFCFDQEKRDSVDEFVPGKPLDFEIALQHIQRLL